VTVNVNRIIHRTPVPRPRRVPLHWHAAVLLGILVFALVGSVVFPVGSNEIPEMTLMGLGITAIIAGLGLSVLVDRIYRGRGR
jgi:hypothetical protein